MPEYTCRKGKIKKQSVTHDHAYIDEDAHKNIDKLDFQLSKSSYIERLFLVIKIYWAQTQF
jgi:hypothetical protein